MRNLFFLCSMLDFDQDGVLVGMEVMADDYDEEAQDEEEEMALV